MISKTLLRNEKLLDKPVALWQHGSVKKYKLVYDATLKRPACILIQAAIVKSGYDIANRFPVKSWLIYPTVDMKLYEVTETQLAYLIKLAEDGVKQGKYKEEN